MLNMKQAQLLIPFIMEQIFSEAETDGNAKRSVKRTLLGTIISVIVFASLVGHGLGSIVKNNQEKERTKVEVIEEATSIKDLEIDLLKQQLKDKSVEEPSEQPMPKKKDTEHEETINRLRRLYELEENKDEG